MITNKDIHIINARTHNLKGIDVSIPEGKLTVVTGVSGSGKSSLAFDTLYAEGQRRYVESLSSYARQFLGRMPKPDVERIENIPPAIAIQQRVTSRNPRSTVGTTTEIYDYLKLLYARGGDTYTPDGKVVRRHTVRDVVAAMEALPMGTRIYLVAPGNEAKEERWQSEGYTRRWHDTWLLVDRIVVDHKPATSNRFADSVQAAFYEGDGECSIIEIDQQERKTDFSTRFEADGVEYMEPSEHLFDFNNPMGACPTCKGFGNIMGIDPNLVVPDPSMSIYEGAIACWRGDKMRAYNDALCYHAEQFGFPIHIPYYELSEQQKQLLWTGNEYFMGLNDFFHELEVKQHGKIQYAVMLARFRGKRECPDCGGGKLRQEAQHVLIGGKNILQLTTMCVDELAEWFRTADLGRAAVFTQVLNEITSRLQFMQDVGLGYLTLNRLSNTLSGGESQRISLAKSLGSSLVGSLYVLDEPSIGLHARDTERLIKVLKQLRDLGNTIVVVEHDEEIIAAADYVIEIGPAAGRHGGEVVYVGVPEKVKVEKLKGEKLNGQFRRPWKDYIEVKNACANNLKNITVRFPLHVMTAVTGVSGSGKSTLIKQLHNIEFVDQNPLSKSSRSNPVTYLKAYDEIRRLYAEQQLSKQMGFTAAHFSFNTPGGRCEECQGEGTITIEMQFMADLVIPCEHCHGRRFKQDTLDVKFRGKSIYDVLTMTINQAIEFFGEINDSASREEKACCRRIVERLKPLQDVGIGYVQLGQSSSTLSGGESQRVKLASYLSLENHDHTVFVFDEPTTGLSHKDIDVLLKALNALVAKGHTVICIEHNSQVIMASDHVIDLGPEGGEGGGQIVFEGTPEALMECEKSYTGKYLKNYADN